MIDTIVLRILNIDQYNKLYEQFHNPNRKKGSFSTTYVDEETAEILTSNANSYRVYHDTGRHLPISFNNTVAVPSSHYSVSTYISHAQNYLEINFSIPKFVFGSNVFQFISMYDQGSESVFRDFTIFIQSYMKMNFVELPLMEDVEINRIDLCYNQFFNSKEDALNYLYEQMKLHVKFTRQDGTGQGQYGTSIMQVRRRYSFKIYHKGTEFAKNDYKVIVKAKNPKNLPLQFLQDQADCILRYEVSFRNLMFNYLLDSYCFSSKTKSVLPFFQSYHISLFAKNLRLLLGDSAYRKYRGTSKTFVLKSLFDDADIKDTKLLSQSKLVTFDKVVFLTLFEFFWNKVKEYQLQSCFSMPELYKRLNDYNESQEMKSKLSTKRHSPMTSRLIIPSLLIANAISLTELKKYMPKATYYRMLADFKKLGIRVTDTNLTMPLPRLDYQDYKIYFSKFH